MKEGKINAVYLSYTKFINTMKQSRWWSNCFHCRPSRCRLTRRNIGWEYIYEPDAQTVIDELLVRYVESLIYQAVAENMASEQSARMVAMKAAQRTTPAASLVS